MMLWPPLLLRLISGLPQARMELEDSIFSTKEKANLLNLPTCLSLQDSPFDDIIELSQLMEWREIKSLLVHSSMQWCFIYLANYDQKTSTISAWLSYKGEQAILVRSAPINVNNVLKNQLISPILLGKVNSVNIECKIRRDR